MQSNVIYCNLLFIILAIYPLILKKKQVTFIDFVHLNFISSEITNSFINMYIYNAFHFYSTHCKIDFDGVRSRFKQTL